MRILICAATTTEERACAGGIEDAGLSGSFEVLRTGMGVLSAGAALKRRLKQGKRPKLIVSSGFAGAFSPELSLHAWVTAKKVVLAGQTAVEDSFQTLALEHDKIMQCTFVTSVDLVVDHSALEQKYIQLPRPLVVDMESAIIAKTAQANKISCMVLRMITDTPANPLPAFLSPFTAAIAAHDTRTRVSQGLKGLRAAVTNPRGIVHIVKEGSGWAKLLRRGWSEHAAFVQEAALNEITRKS